MNAREMRNKLASIKAEAERIHETAKAETRAFTADEQTQYNALIAEGRELRGKLDAIESGNDRSADLASLVVGETRAAQAEDNAEYRKAFLAYLRTGEMRYGQNVATAADGGYTVPEDWAQGIVKAATQENGIGALARQEITGSNAKTIIVRDSIPTAAYADESGVQASGVAYNTSKATFAQVEIPLFKATVKVPVSEELLEDSYFSFDSEVKDAGTAAIQALAGKWFATGNGTKQPYGAFTADAGRTTAASGVISLADLQATKNSVKNVYRKNATWVMNDATLAVCEGIEDGVGNSIVTERVSGDYWMLNRRVVIDDTAPDIASGAKPIIFGDLSKGYCVVSKANGLSIKVNPYADADNGVVEYLFNMRLGGKIVLGEAIKALEIK